MSTAEEAELIAELDRLLRAALAHDDPEEMRDPFLRSAGSLLDYGIDHLVDVYPVWMEIDDIFDHWPVDYGDETDTIAMREVRLAAEEWLALPKTEAEIGEYVKRWRTRQAHDDWPEPGGVWIAGNWGGGPPGRERDDSGLG
ncbi:hypothetical protein [Herbidospora daliensis]|uniref:hypothetical protein n=1 Tax=Herbidospora daliensis TaxID=295585 RepID=UPI00078438D9|nr:hypothetical protein [Herbidospora daliensis]